MKRINPKQEMFLAEYIQHGNQQRAYQAAYGAGVSDAAARANASRLLADETVRARLAELQAAATSDKILTAIQTKELLSAVARREVNDTAVTAKGDLISKPVAIRDAIAAAALLSKLSGWLTNKSEVDLSIGLPVIIRDDI